ncbi:PilW family protein [Vogesella sp. LIG4]|uniref:PilW family protein n=1 Tax=Vogesella sp. LIG4 TaxID=1192162 RepID=UPI00081FF5A1|nr:prepilin-type N-terminal cleavage/methylation domain-containing protein [Vogesella sp. LIG4]SCK18849.1 prepilin-type N-terminal cleavage/methylation domain-containing protein [Vogesella sp. LIG4]
MKRHAGFNLIELMVALTIGMIVILGAEKIYFTTLSANVSGAKMQRFEQTLQILSNEMVTEIRRAGYANPSVTLTAQSNGKYYYPQTSCITFSHSTPAAGGVSAVNEVFYGYQLASNTIYYWNNNSNGNCSTTTSWKAITDPTQIKVTALTFTASGTSLVNINIQADAVNMTTPSGGTVSRNMSSYVRVRN